MYNRPEHSTVYCLSHFFSPRNPQKRYPLYRMKARAPAPTAIMLAPNCIAPPVAVADLAALVAEPETEAEAEPRAAAEGSIPAAERTVAQRCLAMVVIVWRSVAEQSEFWSRQVVPAAWKALAPVVQRQTGSVGEQPEAPTADWMQAICGIVLVWCCKESMVLWRGRTYTALRDTESKVDGRSGSGSGRGGCRGSHGSGGEDGQGSVDAELHGCGVLCVVVVEVDRREKSYRECIESRIACRKRE